MAGALWGIDLKPIVVKLSWGARIRLTKGADSRGSRLDTARTVDQFMITGKTEVKCVGSILLKVGGLIPNLRLSAIVACNWVITKLIAQMSLCAISVKKKATWLLIAILRRPKNLRCLVLGYLVRVFIR